jgi:ketosteroid isomerase-like protein
MSAQRCRDFMRDLESRDLQVLRRWFTETSRLWVPPAEPVTGVRRILALFRAIYRLYGEIHWRVEEVHPLGGSRFVYTTESWGAFTSGKPYRNHIVTIVEFDEEGRILSLSDYFKNTAVFGQVRAARSGPSSGG